MREKLRHPLGYQVGCVLYSLREWFRHKPQAQRRLISGGLGVMVVAILGLVAAMPAITSASEIDALVSRRRRELCRERLTSFRCAA